MVHALEEAWRVLIPSGYMIDLRPVCLDAPVDILYNNEPEGAGAMDFSPDLEFERAADQAIKTVVDRGSFIEKEFERFEIAYYWKTVKGMLADIRERWLDDVVIPGDLTRRAYELFNKHRRNKKVRLMLQMKITSYAKAISDAR